MSNEEITDISKISNEDSLSKEASDIAALGAKKIKLPDENLTQDADGPSVNESTVNSTSCDINDIPLENQDENSQEVRVEIEDPLLYLSQNSEVTAVSKEEASSEGNELNSEEECYMNGNCKGSSNTSSHKNYCPFCSKPQMNLSRHLVTTHQNESKVHEILKLNKLSSPRKKLLEKLRIFGNYLHNKRILQARKGELVHLVKPKSKVDFSDYSICETCFGLFLKTQKEKHEKICSENNDVDWTSYRDIESSTTRYANDRVDSDLKTKSKQYGGKEDCNTTEETETNIDSDNSNFILGLPVNDHDDFQIHSGNHFLSTFLSPELRSIRPISDDLGLNLATMANGDGRKNYCPYCLKPSVMLNRHILSKHSEEQKVQELLKFSKFSEERKRIYEELRVQGNLQYNITALATGHKEALATANFNNDSNLLASASICPNCNLFITAKSLKDHSRKCKMMTEQKTDAKEATSSPSSSNSSSSKPRRQSSRSLISNKMLQ